jgi:hypothetical protein
MTQKLQPPASFQHVDLNWVPVKFEYMAVVVLERLTSSLMVNFISHDDVHKNMRACVKAYESVVNSSLMNTKAGLQMPG